MTWAVRRLDYWNPVRHSINSAWRGLFCYQIKFLLCLFSHLTLCSQGRTWTCWNPTCSTQAFGAFGCSTVGRVFALPSNDSATDMHRPIAGESVVLVKNVVRSKNVPCLFTLLQVSVSSVKGKRFLQELVHQTEQGGVAEEAR